jgi:soluble lytic murein transglycosylase-like protein
MMRTLVGTLLLVMATAISTPPAVEPHRSLVTDQLIEAIIQVESSGNPNAESPRGARGLMQIMKPTWEEVCKRHKLNWEWDTAYDPVRNKVVATLYLMWLENTLEEWMGEVPNNGHLLGAYNGGIGRLRKEGYNIDGMPWETRNYVADVMHIINRQNELKSKN